MLCPTTVASAIPATVRTSHTTTGYLHGLSKDCSGILYSTPPIQQTLVSVVPLRVDQSDALVDRPEATQVVVEHGAWVGDPVDTILSLLLVVRDPSLVHEDHDVCGIDRDRNATRFGLQEHDVGALAKRAID